MPHLYFTLFCYQGNYAELASTVTKGLVTDGSGAFSLTSPRAAIYTFKHGADGTCKDALTGEVTGCWRRCVTNNLHPTAY